jgi:transcriptional regulator of acetoin/glycerol metabolism
MSARDDRASLTASVLYRTGRITFEDIFPDLPDDASRSAQPGTDLALETVERRHILTVLRHTGWNITRAAELLDIARVTLYEKIKRYGLQPPSEAR